MNKNNHKKIEDRIKNLVKVCSNKFTVVVVGLILLIECVLEIYFKYRVNSSYITHIKISGFDINISLIRDFFEPLPAYEIGAVVTVATVLWTLTISLGILALEKQEDKYYGMRIIEVVRSDLGHGRIWPIGALLFLDLVFLIVSIVGTLRLLLLFVLLLLIILALVVSCLVYTEVSRENVEKQIYKQIDNQIDLCLDKNDFMLFKMIKRIDYSSEEDVNCLINALKHVSKTLHNQLICEMDLNKQAYIDNEESLIQCRKINTICKKIASNILEAATVKSSVRYIFAKWMKDESSDLEIKKGILMALVDDFCPDNFKLLQYVISLEEKQYRELMIWVIVYDIYLQRFQDEQWRRECLKGLMADFTFYENSAEYYLAIKYVEQIDVKKRLSNYYELFQFIFKKEGK